MDHWEDLRPQSPLDLHGVAIHNSCTIIFFSSKLGNIRPNFTLTYDSNIPAMVTVELPHTTTIALRYIGFSPYTIDASKNWSTPLSKVSCNCPYKHNKKKMLLEIFAVHLYEEAQITPFTCNLYLGRIYLMTCPVACTQLLLLLSQIHCHTQFPRTPPHRSPPCPHSPSLHQQGEALQSYTQAGRWCSPDR